MFIFVHSAQVDLLYRDFEVPPTTIATIIIAFTIVIVITSLSCSWLCCCPLFRCSARLDPMFTSKLPVGPWCGGARANTGGSPCVPTHNLTDAGVPRPKSSGSRLPGATLQGAERSKGGPTTLATPSGTEAPLGASEADARRILLQVSGRAWSGAGEMTETKQVALIQLAKEGKPLKCPTTDMTETHDTLSSRRNGKDQSVK